MSKRRGKILQDEESISRRQWYNDLQQSGVQEATLINRLHQMEKSRDEDVTSKENIYQVVSSDRQTWVFNLNTPQRKQGYVIFFPGIGQSHADCHALVNICGSNFQYFGVCLPGRSRRVHDAEDHPIFETAVSIFIELKLRNIVTSALRTRRTALTFVGSDLGAMIAFEVARLVENFGYHGISGLIVANAPSPFFQGKNKFGKKYCFVSDRELLFRMEELGGLRTNLDSLPREFTKYFVDQFRREYYLFDRFRLQPPFSMVPIEEDDLGRVSKTQCGSATIGTNAGPTPAAWGPRNSHNSRIESPQVRTTTMQSTSPTSRNNSPVPSLMVSRQATVRSLDAGLTKLEEANTREVGEEEYPVTLYRLHAPITTLWLHDDPFVTRKEVMEWSSLTTNYEEFVISEENNMNKATTHHNCLFSGESLTFVSETILRFSNIEES